MLNRKGVLDSNWFDYNNNYHDKSYGLIHIYRIYNKTVDMREINSGMGDILAAMSIILKIILWSKFKAYTQ